MNVPTVAQVRAYLKHLQWKPEALPDGSVIWRQTPGGSFLVVPDWPDDDTRLLEHSVAINILADATSRTLEETVADILDDDADAQSAVVEAWRATAEALTDPGRRTAPLAASCNSTDFANAPRPEPGGAQ